MMLLTAAAYAQTPNMPVSAGGMPISATTTYGTIVGRVDRMQGVARFFGVPFGATTGGSNRFKATVPPAAWTSSMQTSEYGFCSQFGGSPAYYVGSEDCLKLTVIAPVPNMIVSLAGTATGLATNGTYPVNVWVYGGGFSSESYPFYQYNNALYAAGDSSLSYLPSNGKMVTVFTKYRVNWLGWLSHPALDYTASTGVTGGNWGMYDALMSLNWIQANIGNFGGDPARVTLNGESAGATHTMLLVSSPLSYSPTPLFRGAIMQSLWPTGGNGVTFSKAIRNAAGDYLVGAVGCDPSTYSYNSGTATASYATIMACLQSKSAANIQGAMGNSTKFNMVYGATAWEWINNQGIAAFPCVDGYTLTMTPLAMIQSGANAAVSIIMGSNADEMAFFTNAGFGYPATVNQGEYFMFAGYLWCMWSPTMNTTVGIADAVSYCNTYPKDKIESFYSNIVDPAQREVQWNTDGQFSAQQLKLLDAFAAQSGRAANSVFRFTFAEPNVPSMNKVPTLGTPHTADMNYMWGYTASGYNWLTDNIGPAMVAGQLTYNAAQLALGQTMKNYWANFIHTGAPSVTGDGMPTWTAHSQSSPHNMVFQASVTGGAQLDPCVLFVSCKPEPSADWRRAEANFWQSLFATTTAGATCSTATAGYSHSGVLTPTGSTSYTYQYGSTCNIAGCCSYTTGRRSRSLLFGMASTTTSTSSCNSYC